MEATSWTQTVLCHVVSTLQLDLFLLMSFRMTADMLAFGRELLTSGTRLHIHMLWRDCGFNILTRRLSPSFLFSPKTLKIHLRTFWLLVILSAVSISLSFRVLSDLLFWGDELTCLWLGLLNGARPLWPWRALGHGCSPPQHREVAEQTPVLNPKTWTTILFFPDSPCHQQPGPYIWVLPS